MTEIDITAKRDFTKISILILFFIFSISPWYFVNPLSLLGSPSSSYIIDELTVVPAFGFSSLTAPSPPLLCSFIISANGARWSSSCALLPFLFFWNSDPRCYRSAAIFTCFSPIFKVKQAILTLITLLLLFDQKQAAVLGGCSWSYLVGQSK